MTQPDDGLGVFRGIWFAVRIECAVIGGVVARAVVAREIMRVMA